MRKPFVTCMFLVTSLLAASACIDDVDQQSTDDSLSVDEQSTDAPPSADEQSTDPDATVNEGWVDLPSPETFDAPGVATAAEPERLLSAVKNVGGGTWNYGRVGKHCWSHYVHPTKRHSATALQGPINRKVFANATIWANADIHNGRGRCRAYWSTY